MRHTWIAVAWLAYWLAPLAATASEPLPFLMPDDFEDLDFVAWRVEPGRPDEQNPLVEPAMPWDAGGVLAHGTVLLDSIDGRWKAWQVSIPPVEQPDRYDGRWFKAMLTYLESDDGVRWQRPKLKFVPYAEHEETNILMEVWCTYASVNIDPQRKEWPYEMFALRHPGFLGEPKRIKGLPLPPGKDGHPYGLYRFRSKDGKDWQAVAGPLALETADSCYIYRLADGEYVSYHKFEIPVFPGGVTPWDVADGGVRLIGRRTSADGLTWSNPTQIMLTPDWRDPQDTQFMELCPVAVPGGFVATVTVYHNLTQTIDLQWAASRDGVNWWRPERRPALANAALGDYGGGMMWPMRHPVIDGDRLHVYYTGTEGLHGDIYSTRASGPRVLRARGEVVSRLSNTYGGDFGALCRATWTVDRLWAMVAAHGGYTEGSARTRPGALEGKELLVNMKARPGGRLRVELLDEANRPLPGFTADDCQPLTGDEHAARVEWAGGQRAPAGAAKSRFVFRRAFLYGFDWRL